MRTFIPAAVLLIATGAALVIAFPAIDALAAAATHPTTAVAGQDTAAFEMFDRVEAFYNRAWTMLAIALGIIIAAVGVFVGIPAYLHWHSVDKIKQHVEKMQREVGEKREAVEHDLDDMSQIVDAGIQAAATEAIDFSMGEKLQWQTLTHLLSAAYSLRKERPELFEKNLRAAACNVNSYQNTHFAKPVPSPP